MMRLCCLQFPDQPAILQFELSELDDVHGLVAFGDAGEKVFFVMVWGGIFGFRVFDLLDTVLQSLDFELVTLLVVVAFLYLLEPHSQKIKNNTKLRG